MRAHKAISFVAKDFFGRVAQEPQAVAVKSEDSPAVQIDAPPVRKVWFRFQEVSQLKISFLKNR